MTKQPLTLGVLTELPQRLLDAADAFYFAGMLTSAPFDASHVVSQRHRNARDAGISALKGPNSINYLGAPPIVSFGFAIELYLKLLRFVSDGHIAREHNLLKLFFDLEKVNSDAALIIVDKHRYSCGNRADFVECLTQESSVFEDWRYAHEKELLVTSADTLLGIGDALRDTICELYPTLKSTFNLRQGRTDLVTDKTTV